MSSCYTFTGCLCSIHFFFGILPQEISGLLKPILYLRSLTDPSQIKLQILGHDTLKFLLVVTEFLYSITPGYVNNMT